MITALKNTGQNTYNNTSFFISVFTPDFESTVIIMLFMAVYNGTENFYKKLYFAEVYFHFRNQARRSYRLYEITTL